MTFSLSGRKILSEQLKLAIFFRGFLMICARKIKSSLLSNSTGYDCVYDFIFVIFMWFVLNQKKNRSYNHILLNMIVEKLYLSFSNWFENKRNAIWFQINRKMINKIWFRLDLTRFRKDFSVCRRNSSILCKPDKLPHTLHNLWNLRKNSMVLTTSWSVEVVVTYCHLVYYVS